MKFINRMMVGTFLGCLFAVALQAADAAGEYIGKPIPNRVQRRFVFSGWDQSKTNPSTMKKVFGRYPDIKVVLQEAPKDIPSDDEQKDAILFADEVKVD